MAAGPSCALRQGWWGQLELAVTRWNWMELKGIGYAWHGAALTSPHEAPCNPTTNSFIPAPDTKIHKAM